MKIYFTCPTKDLLKHKDAYVKTRDIIKSLGHTLTRDWIDRSIEYAQTKVGDIPSSLIFTDVLSAILASDIVIIDATVQGTSVGYQIAYALQKGKPVLLLYSTKCPIKPKDQFISGSKFPILTTKNYTLQNISRIIEDYLKNNAEQTKIRFNLVIDKSQDNYIEWAAFTHNKSKTEIIKDAVDKFMDTDDRYQKYLNTIN